MRQNYSTYQCEAVFGQDWVELDVDLWGLESLLINSFQNLPPEFKIRIHVYIFLDFLA